MVVVREAETRRTWLLPFAQRPVLTFEADALAVDVRSQTEDELPRVEVSGRDAPELDVQVTSEGERVRVEANWRKRWRWFCNWDVRLTLVVPRQVDADLKTGAGSLDVRDLGPCILRAKTGAGRMALDDVQGRLTLETGAGQIIGRGVAGSVNARAHTGEVRLEILGLDPGEHVARTDVGAIRIDLAPGLPIQVEAQTKVGSASIEVPNTPDAAARLRLTTDVGAISVREAQATPTAQEPVSV